jgi:DmsE family decaheme c-type cytochrome
MEQSVVKLIAIGLCVFFAVAGNWLVAAEQEPPASEDTFVRLDACEGCHEEQFNDIRLTSHGMAGDPRSPASGNRCASCHGNLEQHVAEKGGADAVGKTAFGTVGMMMRGQQNAVCMGCHKEAILLHWAGSGHASDGVGCVSCHRLHKEDRVRSRRTESEVCFSCHADLRSQINRPYGHPLREQLMTCSDCHNAHGGAGAADLKAFSINEGCYGCHAEKRGPFLWEHIPASENCLLCHSAHGSIHRGMLSRRQPQLCQSCHSPTAGAHNPQGPHARHSRLGLSYRQPGVPDIGPGGPGSRGISSLVMGEGCSNCHNKVHGSNHPSGAKLMR